MKRRLGVSDRFFPLPVPLIVGGHGAELDIVTACWFGVVSSTPATLGVSLRRTRRSLELIRKHGEFTVNVAPSSLVTEVDYCGLVSGHDRDKFADTGLTPIPGAVLATPLIAECPYNVECRLSGEIELGEYVLLLGAVVETHCDDDKLQDDDPGKPDMDRVDPLGYCAGVREYRGLGPKVADGYVVGRDIMKRLGL